MNLLEIYQKNKGHRTNSLLELENHANSLIGVNRCEWYEKIESITGQEISVKLTSTAYTKDVAAHRIIIMIIIFFPNELYIENVSSTE